MMTIRFKITMNIAPSAGLDYWFTQKFGSQFFGEYTRGEFNQRSDFDGQPHQRF